MKINYNINQKYFYIIVKWKIILIVLVLRLWYITGKKYRQSRNATYSEKNIEVVDCNLIIIVFEFQCISIILHRDAVLMMMIIKYLIKSFESHNWNNVIALIKLWFEIQLE